VRREQVALYRMLWLGRVSDPMCEALTPIVRAYEAGKLRCKRVGRTTHCEIIGW
jgi:hypothetical protein